MAELWRAWSLQGCVQEFGVDVRDADSVNAVFVKHAGTIECVWNLAAPL